MRKITSPPEDLMAGKNSPVFTYLRGKSAHSDIASCLWDSVKDLPNVSVYCADRNNFGYVVASINGRVFAFAEGMVGVTLCLPQGMATNLAGRGAQPRTSIGSGWVFLSLFGAPNFSAEISSLVKEAALHSG